MLLAMKTKAPWTGFNQTIGLFVWLYLQLYYKSSDISELIGPETMSGYHWRRRKLKIAEFYLKKLFAANKQQHKQSRLYQEIHFLAFACRLDSKTPISFSATLKS